MDQAQQVLEYNCPCCGAGLKFSGENQKMTCAYCDNAFDLETVKAYSESQNEGSAAAFQWEEQEQQQQWTQQDEQVLKAFICQSCGGQIVTDENTAATFCPYCDNPTVLPSRLSGDLRPDAVIPFQKTKDDAANAFKQLCKGKPLLPKGFDSQSRLDKISGIYVPFWLYDCSGSYSGQYKATRIHHWSDSRYQYTKTDHFLLTRKVCANFSAIPMDASSKMNNTVMESIEPFDLSQMVDFETAYLSGYLADKYDVPSADGQGRIEERVCETFEDSLKSTFIGFSSVIPTSHRLDVAHGKAKYVLLPVWMLHSRYKEKTYVFAMNGQTGKMTGTFPICPKKSAAWFFGVCAAVTALASIITMLL